MATRSLSTRIAAGLTVLAIAPAALTACGNKDEDPAADSGYSSENDGGDFDADVNSQDAADDKKVDTDDDGGDKPADDQKADGELIVDTDGDGIADAPAGTPGEVVGPDDGNVGKDVAKNNEEKRKAQKEQGNPQAAEKPNEHAGGVPNQVTNPDGSKSQINGPKPVEGGKKGSDKDAEEIKKMLNGIYKQDSMIGLTNALKDNSCKAVIEASGGEQAFKTDGMEDIKFKDLGIDVSKNGVTKFEDFRVKGDRASAKVTATTQEGEATETMAFTKESGRWKMCN